MILALPALQAAAEAPGLGGASASGHQQAAPEPGLTWNRAPPPEQLQQPQDAVRAQAEQAAPEPWLTWNRVPPAEPLQQHEDAVRAQADLAAQAKWPGAPPSQDRGAHACACCLVVTVAGC